MRANYRSLIASIVTLFVMMGIAWRAEGALVVQRFSDLVPEPWASSASLPYASGDYVYFLANTGGTDFELWRTTKTFHEAIQVTNFGASGYRLTDGPVALNGSLLLGAKTGVSFASLWTTDGAPGNARLFCELGQTAFDSYTWEDPAVANGKLFFTVTAVPPDGPYPVNREFLVTDGITSPTRLLVEGTAYVGYIKYAGMKAVGGTGYFFVTGVPWDHSLALWKTDGTIPGTTQVKTLPSLNLADIRACYIIESSGLAYFLAPVDNENFGLWHSDGTDSGTTVVKAMFHSSRADGFDGQQAVALGNSVYFLVYDSVTQWELWKTDTTQEGCTKVMVLSDSSESSPSFMLVNNDKLFFLMADPASHHTGLWRSDGTAAGTSMVADLGAYTGCRSMDLPSSGGDMFLSIVQPETGTEPWVSDGTAEGTRILADINPGVGSSNPSHFISSSGHVFFTTNYTGKGTDLYVVAEDGPPLVAFSASPTQGSVPLAVEFTDESLSVGHPITGWLWDFGDGESSTEQNPSHTYEDDGVFKVTLTATNDVGSAYVTKTWFVTAGNAVPAQHAPGMALLALGVAGVGMALLRRVCAGSAAQ